MGHKVGWVTLHAGIAGGADIILLPEIPYDLNVIAEYIKKRSAAGKRFTIIAVAEGAIAKEEAELPKKKLKELQEKKKQNIRPLPMNWQRRSRASATRKSVLRFRGIHKEEDPRARMTEFLRQGLARLRQR